MEITQIYAIAIGGIPFVLIILNVRQKVKSFIRFVSLQTSRYLTYPKLLHRHQHLGPWSPANILLHVFYIAVNAFCIGFEASDIKSAGLRAANLSLINMIPLMAGHHLSVLADILGIPLHAYRQIHRAGGMMSLVLLISHVLVVLVTKTSFPLRTAENIWGFIVSKLSFHSLGVGTRLNLPQGGLSLCFIVPLSHQFCRKWSYEIFLFLHLVLAGLSAYSICRHLVLTPLVWKPPVPQLYAYIFTIMFVLTFSIHVGFLLYRNWKMGSEFSRAYITHAYDTVSIRLKLSRPVKVKAGQYILLWIPIGSVSYSSLVQIHPFTVTSWSEGEQDYLDLFIEPRKGFTKKLLTYSKLHHGGGCCPALFSGPHGISAPIGDYESVVLIASGFGIAAQLPHLKQLIYGYNACKTRTRRVHLVWQLGTIGKTQTTFTG